MVRLQRQLRPRSWRLLEEPVDRDRHAGRAQDVGGPRDGGAADPRQASRDPNPDRDRDVAGARYQHGDARYAVVVRRLGPGRQRERDLEVGADARSAAVWRAALQGGMTPAVLSWNAASNN